MKGIGRIFKRRFKRPNGMSYENPAWWIAFNHRGREHRESSHSESEVIARRLLKKRLAELNAGRFIVNEDRLSLEDMVKDLVNDYEVNGKRSLASVKFYLKHLEKFFGMDRAVDITPDRVRAYQNFRLKEGASNATVNREVATLGRMLTLAVNVGKLSRRPRLQLLEENNVRQGFLEHGDFMTLLDNLRDYLKPLVEFLYLSGWRKGEALKLEWRDVDIRGRVVRLRIENSKNKEARILPLTGRLWEMTQERVRERRLDCPFVFHHEGRKLGDFKKAWKTACKKSGLEGTLIHDLRRCAARNLSRAGVPETVAMEITGHKSRSMYRRYRIVDERDLREGIEKLQAHLETQKDTKVVALKVKE